jgi:hypothetical protein
LEIKSTKLIILSSGENTILLLSNVLKPNNYAFLSVFGKYIAVKKISGIKLKNQQIKK